MRVYELVHPSFGSVRPSGRHHIGGKTGGGGGGGGGAGVRQQVSLPLFVFTFFRSKLFSCLGSFLNMTAAAAVAG